MKKIIYLLLVFFITLSACKKDKKKTDNQEDSKTNTEQVLNDSQQNITKNNTTEQQEKITATTVDDVMNLIKDKHFDGLITGDSVMVLNNKMSMQHIDNYSQKDAIKELDFIDTSKPVYKDEEPVFDGEVFEKSGFFIHDKKYEIIGDWTDANPEMKKKAGDLEKKITKVVEYVDEDTDVKIYLTKGKNGFKIAMIDISTPGEI